MKARILFLLLISVNCFFSQTILENYYIYVVSPKNDTIIPKYNIHEGENSMRLKGVDGKHHYIVKGKLKKIINYVKAKKNGQDISFYENGNVEYIRSYINNQSDGMMIYFYEDGKIEHIENYNYGIETGLWIFYDLKGIVIKKEKYIKGKKTPE